MMRLKNVTQYNLLTLFLWCDTIIKIYVKGDDFMFFDSIKKKIRNKNILWSGISLVVMLFSIYFAISNGFSSDNGWRYGFRFSDIGIPVPNWLVSCGGIVVGIIFAYLFISSIKEIITNKTFNEFLNDAKSIGDLSFVENSLDSTPKNSLAKGELRYNKDLFFYMNGTEVFLHCTKDITSIKPVKKTGKNKEFYVEIQCKEKNIKIQTKEADLLPLANEILSCVKSAK